MTVIPEVRKPRPIKLPDVADHTLPNGLRVLVARRRGIPRFECRLVVPIARKGTARDGARLRVLTETVLSGTEERTSLEIAEVMQGMGGGLGSFADAEQLIVGGSSLASNRAAFLGLFGEILVGAVFPPNEVAIERERVVQEIALQRSQPGVVASDALHARLYGDHPYGWGTPDPQEVGAVTPATLRKLHGDRVRPNGALLVIVGDVDLDATVDDAEKAFGAWVSTASGKDLPKPSVNVPPDMLVVDRPGSVQTTIRMAGPSLGRAHPDFPKLALAVTVFGGYFTSRLNDNIRERKGYTYGASARIEQRRVAAQLTISADVGRDVTAPALIETTYELGRMVALPIGQDELDAARRYLQGTLAMGIQTQSGLTSYLSTIVASGLPVEYLREYPTMLENVTVADVQSICQVHLAPTTTTTVLVGDGDVVARAVEPLGPVARG